MKAELIDMHCHVLPGIDDGSRNTDTSIEMLNLMAEQGVDRIVATPHFYPERKSIQVFLDRRREAYRKLTERLQEPRYDDSPAARFRDRPGELPRILEGAEVAWFRGLSYADRLIELTAADTGVLLLELPFGPWEKADMDEILRIAETKEIHLVLAHLERYYSIRENRSYIEELMEYPLQVQINGEGFLDWKQRRRLLKMLRDGMAHFLGSDSHGVHHRKPNLAEARAVIAKKLGEGFLKEMDQNAAVLFYRENTQCMQNNTKEDKI